MKTLPPLLGAALGGLALCCWVFAAAPAPAKTHALTSISPRKFADALHAVIIADRDAYLRLVGEGGQAASPLPNHVQLLKEAATRIQQRGAEFSYTLRSLQPINPSNGPQTDLETTSLETLARDAAASLYAEESLGGRSYFTAIYPDRATLPSCSECHNRHPDSPRKDYRPGDVMGALVIRVPLEF